MVQTGHPVSQVSTGQTVTPETLALLGPQGPVVLLDPQANLGQVDQLETLGLWAFQVILVHRARSAQLGYQEVLEILDLWVPRALLARWELKDSQVLLEVPDSLGQRVRQDNQAVSDYLVLPVLQETREVLDHWVPLERRACWALLELLDQLDL